MAIIRQLQIKARAIAHAGERYAQTCASNERGASMVEYGLLVAYALLVAVFGVELFGQGVLGLYEAVQTEFEDVRAAQQG